MNDISEKPSFYNKEAIANRQRQKEIRNEIESVDNEIDDLQEDELGTDKESALLSKLDSLQAELYDLEYYD